MSEDVTITVRGEHESRLAPERATIHVGVRVDGPDRATVVESVMRLTAPVRDSLIARADAATVVEWTSKRLSVRAERPWNTEGRRLAAVYYASVDLTATFTEASELSEWVSEVSPWEGVEVGGVDWHLTADTRAATERAVASQAVAVAVARAEAYAGALGLGRITPREIADVGLMSSAQPSSAAPMMMKAQRSTAFAADGGAGMEYEPEDIVISATV
ncbi:SIMPL domain-containing protein [Microbacterium sp. 1.5R]|uniref:SIMPL domain-containing protein n=1 Tax=Microbacterium sp. 1.5R TaxID=1916917 RepID=UPI0011A81206|nr:SIMPL domain-containing protein [Microbacterium sp. 1.5R]